MSRIRSGLIGWASGAVLALTLGMPGIAAAGIANTKHNLTSAGPGVNKTTGTDQICVFCHTPHGSNLAVSAPLWNKALPASSYKTYNSTGDGGGSGVATTATNSIDGQILAVGSVSLACLSCHDGSQAMDNMVNAPGSGSTAIGTGGWSGANQATGAIKAGLFSNLGVDLNNDHPIGIQYCGGGVTGGATTSAAADATVSCNDADFVTTVKNAKINGQQVFWVERDGTATKRGKEDIILYTRDFTSALATPSVECGSCHDPHVETKGTDNVNFMRVTTSGSQICLACHVK
jgi:hypothetical protein